VADKPSIIIVRKKNGGHGHHGGAWKVAYADFVTAMMSLFIVLWLLSSDDKVKKAVGGYFNDPTGTGNLAGTTMPDRGENLTVSKDDMAQLKEKLQQAMRSLPDFKQFQDQVLMTITADGLRVEMLETEKGMFFDSGSSNPTESGQELIARLAKELGALPNKLAIEGHTDSKPFSGEREYSNWELSTDRANAARRIMQTNGLRPDQVTQVRGFADQRLRTPKDPLHAANRRVSVIVLYLSPPAAPQSATSTHPSPVSLPK
jgi:chemotaxis protein MotB